MSLVLLHLPPLFFLYYFFSSLLLSSLVFFCHLGSLYSLNSMNDYRQDNPCCYFHPKEVIVGICALCLKERLLILASKQGHLPLPKDTKRSFRVLKRRPTITLPKVFALGSFLHRLEFRHQRPNEDSDEGSIPSHEDSFISIKFEENGRASWDNKKPSIKPSSEPIKTATKESSKGGRSVVEHTKQRGTVRWRKRIGQLFQLVRWKRSSSKGSVSHVGMAGKVEVVKARSGWIRSLTRRRTTTTTTE